MVNQPKKYDHSYEEPLTSLQKNYNALLTDYKKMERQMNINKEDARLARHVVTEYADALSDFKSHHYELIHQIEEIVGDNFITNPEKIFQIKKIVYTQNSCEVIGNGNKS